MVNEYELGSTQLNELFTALAKAQAEMETCGLNSNNPFFKSKYANLADIIRASRPALTKHGLAVVQHVSTNDKGQAVVVTVLGHSSGQQISSEIRATPGKPDVQSLGSTLTYLRRYAYAALVGVIISDDEDDDGNEASGRVQAVYKNSATEFVTEEQLEDLEYELQGHLDIAENVMRAMKITTLSQFPREKYQASIRKIRELKAIKEQSKAG